MWKGLAGTLSGWALGAVALRAVVVPGEHCPQITSTEALASATSAAEWMARVQRDDGSYLYEYNRKTGLPVPGYNSVRHAGVTMSLYQLAGSGDRVALATADRGMGWLIANSFEHDDWTALRDPDDGGIESGGNALMLAALTQRRLATGDRAHDELMRRVARYLLVMQQDDGSYLLAWDPATGAPNPAYRSKYATGEAFWALTLMHRIFPSEGWDAPAREVADYLSLHRDTVEEQKYPPWADQWAAYGLAEMATWPPNDANIAYARTLAERFGFLVRNESQRTKSGFSKLFHGREARAAGMGTWSEALDSLWRLASIDPRMADMKEKLGERAACAAGMLYERQVQQAARGEERGAWFTEGVTRMDDQQHALSGLLRAREVIDARAAR